MRTLARLGTIDAVVLQVNEPTGPATAAGAREVVDGSAHWRAGLRRAVDRLQDAQLIVLEDRDEDPDLSRGIGEDIQVAVLAAGDVDALQAARMRDAQAIVLMDADEPATAACRERFPGLRVFAVSPGPGDEGMEEWSRWVAQQVLRRRG
jgi:hypothetical protein